jgi:DNA-binding CsgD family transcriptional regulator/PAS domain-containing protein
MTLEQFQSALTCLYDAALGSVAWPVALQHLAALLDARAADLVLADPASPSPVRLFTHNLPCDEAHQAGFAELAPENPRLAFTLAHPAVPLFHDALFIDGRGMDRSAFYAWIERTGDIRHYLGIAAAEAGSPCAGLSMHWSRADGAPGEPWRRETLLLLRPHLERALQIGAALATGRAVQSMQQQALLNPGRAVLVLDAAGALVFQNEEATALLGQGRVLRRRDRFLEAVQPADRIVLDRLVREAAASVHGRPLGRSGACRLLDARTGRAMRVTVSPYPAAPEPFSGMRPAVLVVCIGPSGEPAVGLSVALEGFGFTAREAEVASLLLEGLSPKQIAARMDVSINTVRTHLARVLDKAGVRRQADLVRRLLGHG